DKVTEPKLALSHTEVVFDIGDMLNGVTLGLLETEEEMFCIEEEDASESPLDVLTTDDKRLVEETGDAVIISDVTFGGVLDKEGPTVEAPKIEVELIAVTGVETLPPNIEHFVEAL